jgi:hypothetical protein
VSFSAFFYSKCIAKTKGIVGITMFFLLSPNQTARERIELFKRELNFLGASI